MRWPTILAACAGLMSLSMGAGAQPAPSPDTGLQPVKAVTMMSSAIPCSDLDRSIAFYSKGLGLTLGGRIEMGTVIEAPMIFPGGGAQLLLLHSKTKAPIVPRTSLNRIVLQVPDLKALAARLNAAGYALKGAISENRQHRVSVAHLEDPDGNQIELVQRNP